MLNKASNVLRVIYYHYMIVDMKENVCSISLDFEEQMANAATPFPWIEAVICPISR